MGVYSTGDQMLGLEINTIKIIPLESCTWLRWAVYPLGFSQLTCPSTYALDVVGDQLLLQGAELFPMSKLPEALDIGMNPFQTWLWSKDQLDTAMGKTPPPQHPPSPQNLTNDQLAVVSHQALGRLVTQKSPPKDNCHCREQVCRWYLVQ